MIHYLFLNVYMVARVLYLEYKKFFYLRFRCFPKFRRFVRVFLNTKLIASGREEFRLTQRLSKRFLFGALLLVIVILLGLTVIDALQPSLTTLSSRGRVKVVKVGIYVDINCIGALEYLDWGTLEPGAVKNVTIYVRNEGNQAAALFWTVENWNPPEASNYVSLSWNCDGRTLGLMETVKVILTLSVSPEVESICDFSFDVIIGING